MDLFALTMTGVGNVNELFMRIHGSYLDAHPARGFHVVLSEVTAAFERAKVRHPGFSNWVAQMGCIATLEPLDWREMDLDDVLDYIWERSAPHRSDLEVPALAAIEPISGAVQ